MSIGRRIVNIIIGLLMISGALLILVMGEEALDIVALIVIITMLVYSIGRLIYYFTMARFMVGGRSMLYLGVMILDAALFLFGIYNKSSVFVMIYLIIMYAFSGVFDLLNALEAKKMSSPTWKRKMFSAIVSLLIVVACGVFITNPEITVIIFCVGLIYSAVVRIISAFQKTAVLYISP